MSVEGSRELEEKLDKLLRIDHRKMVAEAIQKVRSDAVLRCPVDTGKLRQSIYVSLHDNGDVVQATCFTNEAYGVYVEFGTGPKGQENHSGISPDVNPAYTQTPWWIHESQINKEKAEQYRWFYIDTPNGRFYQCTGMRAYPFMYPALKDNRDEILKGMAERLEVEIKEKTK